MWLSYQFGHIFIFLSTALVIENIKVSNQSLFLAQTEHDMSQNNLKN